MMPALRCSWCSFFVLLFFIVFNSSPGNFFFFVVLHVLGELVLHVVIRTFLLSVGSNHLNFLLFGVFFLGLSI